LATIKILLVDGLNLIRRIFEANHRDDVDITACVDSCVRSLGRAMEAHRPSHIAVVLDSHETTWRHLLYPEYKGDRKPTPPALINNLDQFKSAFKHVGVASIMVGGYEADDVLSTLAAGVAESDGEVIILSTDKGFLSLLSDRIKVYHHFEQHFVTSADVHKKYQIRYDQLVDYWSLSGDPGNNIKGVPGVGKKTAVLLLNQFDRLDEILLQARNLAIEKTSEPSSEEEKLLEKFRKPLTKVLAHEDVALLCRLLVTPKLDVELGVNLRTFRL
jgi:protein Xni